MAYLSEQDDDKARAAQLGVSSPSQFTGTSGGAAPSALGAPPSLAAGAGRPQGTGFVNAAQFLAANERGAEGLGGQLANTVLGEGSAAADAQERLQSAFNSGIGHGTQGASGQNQYQDLSNTPGYEDASAKAQRATADAQGLTSGEGRGGLLSAYYGDAPGSGANAWDSFYAGAGKGNAGLFLNTQNQVGNQIANLDAANVASGTAAPPVVSPPAPVRGVGGPPVDTNTGGTNQPGVGQNVYHNYNKPIITNNKNKRTP